MKRRKPINRVSRRRQAEGAVYLGRRKAFLAAHPYCQVWLAEHGVSEEDAKANGGWVAVYINDPMAKVPLATDIHHRAGRIGGAFLDETTWMAVSRASHRAIHDSPSWARQAGYLL